MKIVKVLLLLLMVSCTGEYDIKRELNDNEVKARDKVASYCKCRGGLAIIDFWTDTFKFSCKDSCAGLEFSYYAEFTDNSCDK